ncbi:hypothetical protein RND61_23945 [Streptomyces sp. TRM76323]|uniref:Cytochrome C oxidase subunit I n=1 Tax=Streptomyces tamarix TaxID=3078565 RepID=A0ABU3QRR6_9ACTN|nr:hypothetical protein [Streptomyces tamarix]MDT9685087.1 hypothetical protein [Streptomyces tamarix]
MMPGRPREHTGAAAGPERPGDRLAAETRPDEIRRQADAFALRLPWLTTAQHEEVARLYAEDRVEQVERALGHLTRRAAELREEYARRYEQLRRRLLCMTAASLAAGVFALVGLTAWVLALR